MLVFLISLWEEALLTLYISKRHWSYEFRCMKGFGKASSGPLSLSTRLDQDDRATNLDFRNIGHGARNGTRACSTCWSLFSHLSLLFPHNAECVI
jgi:hypothetical protein